MIKNCEICGLQFETIKQGHTRVYCFKCSPTGSMSNRQIQQDSMNIKRRAIKQHLVNHFGGQCSVCGYNKCLEALEFHHLDPTKKDFTLGAGTKSFKTYLAESDKCILLCANCHRELHNKIIS